MNSSRLTPMILTCSLVRYTLLASIVFALTGCIQSQSQDQICSANQSAIGEPSPCEDGYVLASADECNQGECISRQRVDACGNTTEILCREIEDCPAIALPNPSRICANEGLEVGTEELCEAGNCRTITLDLGCGYQVEILCIESMIDPCLTPGEDPSSLCLDLDLEIATAEECETEECRSFETGSDECGYDTIWCRVPTGCDEDGFPNPESVCEERGLELGTEEDCETYSCSLVEIEVGCGEYADIICFNSDNCLESPAFPPSEACIAEGLELATAEDCAAGECQEIEYRGRCGIQETILCREPRVNCRAIPVCSEGMVESSNPCRRGEESCEEPSLCGTTITCRPELVCDAVPSCNDPFGEYASIYACENNDTDCYAVHECGSTIFCRPQTLCEAELECESNDFESLDPCLASESADECYTRTMCGTTVVCRPQACTESGAIPPAEICMAEGLELALEGDCEEGECQEVSYRGACGVRETVLCREPQVDCLAIPICAEGMSESSNPCLRGEESCEELTMCGHTITCRPGVVCYAEPSCNDSSDVASIYACEDNDPNCYAVNECGQTLFCRPQSPCLAIPSCEPDSIESFDPCLASESLDECYTQTMCGTTVACRPLN